MRPSLIKTKPGSIVQGITHFYGSSQVQIVQILYDEFILGLVSFSIVSVLIISIKYCE